MKQRGMEVPKPKSYVVFVSELLQVNMKTKRDKIRDFIADRIADIIIGAIVIFFVGLYVYTHTPELWR